MSFILDALKKSDQARRVADIPELDYWVQATDPVKPVNWAMILLVCILLFNLLAVGGWWIANAHSLDAFWLPKTRVSMDSTPLPHYTNTNEVLASMPAIATPQSQRSESPSVDSSVILKQPAQWVVGPDTLVVKDVKDLGSQFDELGYEIIRPGSGVNRLAVNAQSSQQTAGKTILSMADVPDSIRSELPEFDIISHIYTQTPHRRSVIINQSRYRQGDEVSAGLRLETIETDHLVFSYLGTHFRYPVRL